MMRLLDVSFRLCLIAVELHLLAAALENCPTSNLQPNGNSCTANFPCYCSSLNQDIIIQCDKTQKLSNYFDGRTGQRICPLEMTGFSEHHKKCLNDSVNQEFKLNNTSHNETCGSVMSKGCVTWIDDNTASSSSCMCESTKLKLKSAGISKHLNIYNSYTGALLCNISKTTTQVATRVRTTITTGSTVSSTQQLSEVDSSQISTESNHSDQPQKTNEMTNNTSLSTTPVSSTQITTKRSSPAQPNEKNEMTNTSLNNLCHETPSNFDFILCIVTGLWLLIFSIMMMAIFLGNGRNKTLQSGSEMQCDL